MININMNNLLESGISRYALVIGVAKRATEITTEENERRKRLQKANDPEKNDVGTEKSVTLAVNEYLEKKFEIVDPNKKIATTDDLNINTELPVFLSSDDSADV